MEDHGDENGETFDGGGSFAADSWDADRCCRDDVGEHGNGSVCSVDDIFQEWHPNLTVGEKNTIIAAAAVVPH